MFSTGSGTQEAVNACKLNQQTLVTARSQQVGQLALGNILWDSVRDPGTVGGVQLCGPAEAPEGDDPGFGGGGAVDGPWGGSPGQPSAPLCAWQTGPPSDLNCPAQWGEATVIRGKWAVGLWA